MIIMILTISNYCQYAHYMQHLYSDVVKEVVLILKTAALELIVIAKNTAWQVLISD